MKLIIQIPCLNEEDSLPKTYRALPRQVSGFDVVEVMVIDDGSTDQTASVAQILGVDHIVRMHGRQGLARAFVAGLAAAVERGADVIVNTDADNQYCASDIGALTRPILDERADMVIGIRPLHEIRHFSLFKRVLQQLGSRVVQTLSGACVQDAASGFRAISKHAAMRLSVFSNFTYTIETVIQAGQCNMRIANVPIHVNGPTRPSRLFRSNVHYVWRSILTMINVYIIYRPTLLFGFLAAIFFFPGLALGVRYLFLASRGEGPGHVHSLIACAICVLSGVFTTLIGVVAHLLSINRRLLEEVRFLQRSPRLDHSGDASISPKNGDANSYASRE